MAKIFGGGKVYEAANEAAAIEALYDIARMARGAFEGCECRETGFYVDKEQPVHLGEGKKLYHIRGALAGKCYAETDDPEILG